MSGLKKESSGEMNGMYLKVDQLIEVATENTKSNIELKGDIKELVVEFKHFGKNMGRMEEKLITQENTVTQVVKDVIVLQTQRDGKWKTSTFACAAIAAVSTVALLIMQLMQLKIT